MTTSLSTIWENTDGCAEQYICASAVYLMSVMSQCYFIIIDQGISAPGHGKEVLDGLNYVDKCYLYQLISTVQITGSNIFDSQMQMYTGNQKYYVILAKEFQHHLTKEHCKNGVFDQGKNNKQFMERKWTDGQYHVQDNADVSHQGVKFFPLVLSVGDMMIKEALVVLVTLIQVMAAKMDEPI